MIIRKTDGGLQIQLDLIFLYANFYTDHVSYTVLPLYLSTSIVQRGAMQGFTVAMLHF